MRALLAAAVALFGGAAPGLAQAPEGPSLAGKTVSVFIGFGTGGNYDSWGRTVARHIGKHLPGRPVVVPQNMPGAGGLVAANSIYNIAPKDGTAMAIVASSTPLATILGAPGARFDATKFTYLGTPTPETCVCVAFNRPQMKVRTLKDLYDTEFVVGSSGPGSGTYTWPKTLNALLGMKFKIVIGFPSITNGMLAMERGEVDGLCTTYEGIVNLRPDWIEERKLTILLQGGAAPNPELKDVAFATDLAKTAQERTALAFVFAGLGFGRPFIAPPAMAPERAKMLQDAFMATMQDPDFRADAQRQRLDVDPKDGPSLAALIGTIHATPKAVVDRVVELIK
jgi:tripartite-type tricarboxylate transporter receptor subunit TctC